MPFRITIFWCITISCNLLRIRTYSIFLNGRGLQIKALVQHDTRISSISANVPLYSCRSAIYIIHGRARHKITILVIKKIEFISAIPTVILSETPPEFVRQWTCPTMNLSNKSRRRFPYPARTYQDTASQKISSAVYRRVFRFIAKFPTHHPHLHHVLVYFILQFLTASIPYLCA